MNSIQRVLAAVTFGKGEYGAPDRVPVLPVPLMQGALVHECSPAQYFQSDADALATAQIRINEMFDGIPDGVAGFPNVIEDISGFGVALKYDYPNSSPTASRMLIREFAEIDALRCPNPQDSADLSKTLEVISLLKQRIGSEKLVIGACIAPFSLPSMLMGTSKWMRLLYTPELFERHFDHIIDVCTRFVVRWAQLQLQAGAHIVVLADGMASATMLPRDRFQMWALPVIRDVIAKIDGIVAYEAVGHAEPLIDLLATCGAAALLVGESDDLRECKRAADGRVALVGNVNNMKMRRWSPSRIELAAKSALAKAMDGYGFILGNQGPEIPFDTDVAGIGALIHAVEKYGRYDTADLAA